MSSQRVPWRLGGSRGPLEPVQLQALPQRQRQPARAPLGATGTAQGLELDLNHFAVQLRRLPVRREQRHRHRARVAAQHLDGAAPHSVLAVVDLPR